MIHQKIATDKKKVSMQVIDAVL